jgi:hypothetical protein
MPIRRRRHGRLREGGLSPAPSAGAPLSISPRSTTSDSTKCVIAGKPEDEKKMGGVPFHFVEGS